MFTEGLQSQSPVKEGFSLAGKKATGMNIASKQTRNMDTYVSYDIGTLPYYKTPYFRKKDMGRKKSEQG